MTDSISRDPLSSRPGSDARTIRVLHLIDHMGAGGAQRVVLDLVESSSPRTELSVVSLRDHFVSDATRRLLEAKVVYRGLGLTKRYPFGVHRLRSVMAEWRPHVVHSHLEVSSTLAALAVMGLDSNRPKVINHLHNDPDGQFAPWHRAAGRFLAPRFDAHIVPTETIGRAMDNAFGHRHRRLEVIPNGIDPAWLLQGSTERTAALRGGAKFVVGTIGRLVEQKATHTLLEATPRLLAVEPSTRVLIVGDGPLMTGLVNSAKSLDIEHAVEFLGYSDDLASIYSAVDVFVLPSKYEGFPISLLEAMAMGRPIVGTAVVGITDVIEDRHNGLLVPFNDPVALAAAILEVLSDEQLRTTLGSNARRFVEQGYTRDRVATRLEALYLEITSPSPA